MTRKRTVCVRFKVQELFPPEDPVVTCLLRLMAAVNDLRTLQLVWLHAAQRKGSTASETETIKAEHLYVFRLICATLYEAGGAFQDFRKALEETERLSEVDKMEEEGRTAFHALRNAFHEGFEETYWGKILIRLRHSAFHYPKPRVFRRALREYSELGHLIVGEIAGISRYLIADELQVQIVAHTLGPDFEGELNALSQTASGLAGHLRTLVDYWLDLQLQLHDEAIVDEVKDTVEIERLWNIPGLGSKPWPGP